MPSRLLVCLIAGFLSVPALGQESIPQSFLEELARDLSDLQSDQGLSARVVNDDVDVHAGVSAETEVIGRLNVGDPANVISKAGGWYGVLLPDKQVGWVQTHDVKLGPQDIDTFRDTRIQIIDPEEEAELKYGWVENRILTLLKRAAALRDTYRDNPYVVVRGFEISMSLTGPTLGMSFEFKE